VLRVLLKEELRPGSRSRAVGYLAYDLKRFVERVPETATDDLGVPEMYFCFYDQIARFDARPLAPPEVFARAHAPEGWDRLASTIDMDDYERAVRRALDYIVAGDIYQVNLSQRFQTPFSNDPFSAYLMLRRANPAPFAAYLNFPELQVLSASPERFLRFDPAERIVETRPIKGTRARGRTTAEDAALRAELQASKKDRAENVMIVDLERNDLGRVAEIASVAVTGLCELESYATVHHLTSTVQARLRTGLGVVDLLRATFPGGSITGAPKVRAMEIIDELEPTARGIYTGAIGYIGSDESLDLNIAIRTAVIKDKTVYFQVGGGIVADSDPAAEYEETLHKGAALANVFLCEATRDGL